MLVVTDTLSPNPVHPLASMPPEKRERHRVTALAVILAKASLTERGISSSRDKE